MSLPRRDEEVLYDIEYSSSFRFLAYCSEVILASYSGDSVVFASPVGIPVAHVHCMHMHLVHLLTLFHFVMKVYLNMYE